MSKGVSNYGFDVDLREAKLREEALATLLTDKTYELKDERRKAPETGNVFIEVSQPDGNKGRKPSGINVVPHADIWVFEVDDGVYIVVPYEHLIAVVDRITDAPNFRHTWGGDFNRYEGVLVPIVELLRRNR